MLLLPMPPPTLLLLLVASGLVLGLPPLLTPGSASHYRASGLTKLGMSHS
jgi:hypothetical protein